MTKTIKGKEYVSKVVPGAIDCKGCIGNDDYKVCYTISKEEKACYEDRDIDRPVIWEAKVYDNPEQELQEACEALKEAIKVEAKPIIKLVENVVEYLSRGK